MTITPLNPAADRAERILAALAARYVRSRAHAHPDTRTEMLLALEAAVRADRECTPREATIAAEQYVQAACTACAWAALPELYADRLARYEDWADDVRDGAA